jgi:hypothetical protein
MKIKQILAQAPVAPALGARAQAAGLVAIVAVAGLTPPAARADVIFLNSTTSTQYAPATTTIVHQNAYDTTVVGKLDGGVIFDQTFGVSATSLSVLESLAAADAAILAAAPGAVLDAPVLTSSIADTLSTQTSYSLDPNQPPPVVGVTIDEVNNEKVTLIFIDTITLLDPLITETYTATTDALYEIDALDRAVGVAPGVPEPASWALMLLGFGGLGAALRGRRVSGAVANA